MKKKIAIAIIVILIIGAGAWALYHFVLGKSAAAGQDRIYVQLVKSLQSYGGYGNRYNGVVDTQKTENVELDSDRKLDQLFVAEGDHVKTGDALFSYDTESISLEIDQINLEIQKLEQDVSNNSALIEELTRLLNNAPESERLDYSTQIAELQSSIAQEQYDIKSRQAEISKKKASIDNSTVYATLDGNIKKIADADALLSGSNFDSNGNPDTTFITIMAEGDFRIKGSITESNIYEISTGEKVIIRSRVNDDSWKGTISSIDTQSNESQDQDMYYYDNGGERATRYPFYVELDSIEGLMLGQHVTIEPDTGEDPTGEGIWLGSGFIVLEENADPYVWAAASEGAALEKRTVVLGRYIEETDQYEISSGLSEKEYIAWPDSYCREGAPTTSEYIVPESESEGGGDFEDPEMTEESYDFEGGPESFSEDALYDEENAADTGSGDF